MTRRQPDGPGNWKTPPAEVPATPQGHATPERVEYLRSLFPRTVYPWTQDKVPSRDGGVTEATIADARAADPIAGELAAWWLERRREFHLVRWREWFDRMHGGDDPEERRRVASVVRNSIRQAERFREMARDREN